jgi:hypothetical protein
VTRRGRRARALAWAGAAAFAISATAEASPAHDWISLCTAAGPRLIAATELPGPLPAPRDDQHHGICAHAACARELRPDGKGRGRS